MNNYAQSPTLRILESNEQDLRSGAAERWAHALAKPPGLGSVGLSLNLSLSIEPGFGLPSRLRFPFHLDLLLLLTDWGLWSEGVDCPTNVGSMHGQKSFQNETYQISLYLYPQPRMSNRRAACSSNVAGLNVLLILRFFFFFNYIFSPVGIFAYKCH